MPLPFCRTKTSLTDKFGISYQFFHYLRIFFEYLIGDITQSFTFHFLSSYKDRATSIANPFFHHIVS